MIDKWLRVGLALGVGGTAVLLWSVPDFAAQQALAFALLALWPMVSWSRLFPGGWAARLLSGGGLALLLQTLLALLLHYLPGAPPRVLLVASISLVGLLPLLWPGQPWPVLPRLQKREWWLLAALVLLTLLLRWPNLGYKEFQGDEGVIITRAAAMLTGDDAELFLHQKGPVEILLPFLLWGSGTGVTEFWVRLPFWWASVLLVGVMVWLGRRWFSKEIGLLVGVVFVLNGFGVAFSRIVQYQTLVMLWGALAITFADLYREQGRRHQLWVTAVFLAGGLLAHYDAVLVVPVIAWLLWPRLWPLARQEWRTWGVALLVGGGTLALFYLPFVLNPNFGRTGSYLFSDRLGGSLLSWSGPEVWQMATFYNSLYYIAGLLALIGLGAGWRNGRRTAAWLYFLVPLFFYVFVVADPRTHVYTFFPGAAVLAALGVAQLKAWRGVWGVLALVGVVTAVYPFLLFIDTSVERQRGWAELRPAGYPTTFAEPPLFGLFGFPYQAGWRAVADLPLTPPIASNEEQEITDVYLGQAARTFCPDANTFILAQNVQDSVPYDPALLGNWHLQYEVMVNGRQTMQIFSREPVAEVARVEVGDSEWWLGETAVAPAVYHPTYPLDVVFGEQQVRLLGFDLEDSKAYPGGEIQLTLYWQSLAPLAQNYQVFAHLVQDDIVGQHDGTPECGVNPTARWEVGQVVADVHVIPIAAAATPGSALLKVGMYELATLNRLPIASGQDNMMTLMAVTIQRP